MVTTPADPDLIHMATLHPADGRALRYHVDEQMIGWVQQLAAPLLKTPCFEAAASELDADLLGMFVEQALHGELLGTRRALVRRQYLASQGQVSDKPVACPAQLLPLVENHWPDSRFPLRGIRPDWRQSARKYLREFLVERSWRWKSKPLPAPTGKSMVSVELVEGADPDSKCDAFWLANGAFDASRVLFVLERGNLFFFDPAAQQAIIRRIGAHAVALHPSASANGAIPLWYPQSLPTWTARLKRRLPKSRSSSERWLRSILLHCINRVGYWEAFFSWYKVAVHQQFSEANFEIIAKRMAIARLNGVETGKMRSEFFDLGSTAFYFHHQVAFVWHQRVRPYLKYGRNRTEYSVNTGYVYDHLFECLKTESMAIRESLLKSGARRILAVYDNMPHLDSHSTHEQLADFYDIIIRAAIADPTLGLLVKSKKPHVLRALPRIKEQLATLETTGRCHVISELGKPVAIAAMACDFAAGFPVSTALCETMISGRPGIMYDPGGAPAHPFTGVDDRVVYNSIQDFERALLGMLDPRRPADADYLPLLRLKLDKYLDGNSHLRAARFIEEYLRAFDAGTPSREAMKGITALLPYCEPL